MNRPMPIDWSPAQLAAADRALLVRYLESWGYQCYDHETTEELRQAAYDNVKTEGYGFGPCATL